MSVAILDKPALQVSTIHVEIKALMVGKKQFTIAMLKQLQEIDIDTFGHYVEKKDDRGRVRMVEEWVPDFSQQLQRLNIWGYVRYRLDGDNIHLILEECGRLLRISDTDHYKLKLLGIDLEQLDQLFIAV